MAAVVPIEQYRQWQRERDQIFALIDKVQQRTQVSVEELEADIVVADDPTDDKYLACALEADASYIVTGDGHLQRLDTYRGVKIVSLAVLLQILEGAA